jgi:hypothetical protein
MALTWAGSWTRIGRFVRESAAAMVGTATGDGLMNGILALQSGDKMAK